MYSQYTRKFETEVGSLEIEYTHKIENDVTILDSMLITVDGRIIECPKSWYKQTTQAIVRKVCVMIKAG
jgi:hypothetical protein